MNTMQLLVIILVAGCVCGLDVEAGRCKSMPNTPQKVAEGVRQCSEEVKTNMIKEAFNIIRYQWDQQQQPQKDIVHHVHHVYRPNPKTQNIAQTQSINTQVYPPLVRQSVVPVNYSEALPTNHYQNAFAKPIQQLVRLYTASGQPAVYQQPMPLQLPQLTKPPHLPVVQQVSNYLQMPNVPDETKYYQYVPFDPNVQRRRRDDNLGMTLQDKRIAGCLMHCIYSKHHAVDHMGWPTLDGLVSFYSEGVQEHPYFMATLRASNTCLKGLSTKYNVNRLVAPAQGQSCDLSFDVFDCISDKLAEFCAN